MLTANQITQVENLPVEDSIRLLTQWYPNRVVFSSSLGQEDQVLTAIIAKNNLPVEVFTLDTGRLFNESYELLERTTARYKIPIKVYFPETKDVEAFVNEKGINSFYESVANRKECCFIRKVKPLNRALNGAKIWITGLRAEQSANRNEMPMIEWLEEKELYKFNPLLHWNNEEVLSYIQKHNVPCSPLHDKGFISIGCAPCTRAVEPGEEVRAGRWWWETSQKECGLHIVAEKQT